MASTRNSARKKRKYGDQRKATTAKNKVRKQLRHENRAARMAARTSALFGRKARARTKNGPVEGHITDVIWDKDTLRKEGIENPVGMFVVVSPVAGHPVLRARRRVKVLA